MKVETNCPVDEDLAAFVEGVLEEPRRTRVVSHLAGCADCRDVVVETRRALSAELPEPAPGASWARPWLALAAAAAVVAALAGGILVGRPSPPRALGTASVEAALAGSLRGREGWSYQPSLGPAAFAASQSARRVAFDLGALELDRRLAAASGLDEASAAALESAALLLSRLETGAPLAERLVEQAQGVRQGRHLPSQAGLAEVLAESGLPRAWFERGVRWERARLSAIVRVRAALDLEAVALDAERSGLPQAPRVALELRGLAAAPVWREAEWRSLDRALAALMQLP